jgi:hypothetical protein
MPRFNCSKVEVARALQQKLNLHFRSGKERNAWFHLDGVPVIRVTMPKGRGQLAPGTAESIRNQVRLSRAEFLDLIKCPLKESDYLRIIRKKREAGLL